MITQLPKLSPRNPTLTIIIIIIHQGAEVATMDVEAQEDTLREELTEDIGIEVVTGVEAIRREVLEAVMTEVILQEVLIEAGDNILEEKYITRSKMI